MLAGERFKSWIDQTAVGFADRLTTWGMGLIAKGVTKTLDDLEPAAIDQFRDTLTKLRDNPATPKETRDIIDKALEEGNILNVIMGWFMTVLQMIPTILGGSQPIGNLMRYDQEKIFSTFRLEPTTIGLIWLRDKSKWEFLWDDLRDQGWSEARIDAAQELTKFLPGPQDLITWLAKEVFEPDMVRKYGLDAETAGLNFELFDKIGVAPEQVMNYWRAHWEHPSYNQVVEMLRRTDFTEEDMREWFRLVEVPPFWRDKMIEISYAVPTRVDVRRFWDMRTIDEERLRELYVNQGYHGKDLDDYVLWTKVYTDFPVLMARWRNGWISLDDVKSELARLGMPEARIEDMIQEKIKAEQPERVAADRNITITDIYKGVKTNRITRSEAVELLIEYGFDEDEAVFKLEVNIPLDDEDIVVAERELSKTDIRAGLAAEELSEEEVVVRLQILRYSLANSQLLLRIFKATIKPPAEDRDRQASKADIVAGVKKAIITPKEGYIMLQDIGFSPEASEFILLVKAEESPFSPVSFTEFKDLTQKYRRAIGQEAKTMPEELVAAAAAVVKLTAEVDALDRSIKDERRGLIADQSVPEEATARLTELELLRNRAISELERLQQEYDGLIAEWRQRQSV